MKQCVYEQRERMRAEETKSETHDMGATGTIEE